MYRRLTRGCTVVLQSVDSVTNTLNNALKKLEDWSSKNNLVPHPKKCEAIIDVQLKRGSFTGPLNALALCNHTIKWVTHARLLGVAIDDKLTWAQRITEVKKSFVNKLNLLKRSSLPRNILLDLYFKIILPSVSYALPIIGEVILLSTGFLPWNLYTVEPLS